MYIPSQNQYYNIMVRRDSRSVITSLFSVVVGRGALGWKSHTDCTLFSEKFLLPEGPDAGLSFFSLVILVILVILVFLHGRKSIKVNSLSGRSIIIIIASVVVVQRFLRPVTPPFSQLGAASSASLASLHSQAA